MRSQGKYEGFRGYVEGGKDMFTRKTVPKSLYDKVYADKLHLSSRCRELERKNIKLRCQRDQARQAVSEIMNEAPIELSWLAKNKEKRARWDRLVGKTETLTHRGKY